MSQKRINDQRGNQDVITADDNFIWAEKYRPTSISDIILPVNLKNVFDNLIKQGNVTNLRDLLVLVRLLLQKHYVKNLIVIILLLMDQTKVDLLMC